MFCLPWECGREVPLPKLHASRGNRHVEHDTKVRVCQRPLLKLSSLPVPSPPSHSHLPAARLRSQTSIAQSAWTRSFSTCRRRSSCRTQATSRTPGASKTSEWHGRVAANQQSCKCLHPQDLHFNSPSMTCSGRISPLHMAASSGCTSSLQLLLGLESVVNQVGCYLLVCLLLFCATFGHTCMHTHAYTC